MSLQFRILGALEADEDGRPIAIRGRRRRALLGRLLISPNQPVDVDRLAHDVWSDAPPPGAASTLASHVSLLRSILGADRLQHHPGGYRLTVGADELDAVRFEADLRAAQRHARQAGLQRAADLLVAALALWRGSALGDLGDAPWARGEVARLEELRLGAEELLLTTRLDLGQHREITADAEAAVNDHPLREQRWAVLMLALYRSGRQADALRSFQRLRSLLDDQLGVEPSPDVADLEQAIVLQSPELVWSTPAPTPVGTGPQWPGPAPSPGRAPGAPGGSAVVPAEPAIAQTTEAWGPPDDAALGTPADRQSDLGVPDAVPLVDALRSTGAPFVGRAEEQARLARLFADAAGGHREVALVGGEPGIGKSTLAAAAARHADAAGGVVLYGRCLEVATAPYQPFVEALEYAVRHAPVGILRDHVAQYGGALTRLVPALATRVPDVLPPATTDPDIERYLAFGAAAALLARMSREQPVLLLLEDLHWADMATLQMLRHLIGHSHRTPMLILATFRSNEITTDHPLSDTFAALWREVNVTRFDLEGLDRDEIEDLCVSYAGDILRVDAVARIAADLRNETAGNPFFVCELLRSIAETGDLALGSGSEWSTGPAVLGSEVPRSLRDVVAQRVHRLGTKAERVLVLAAVIGGEFNLTTLAGVSDLEPEDLLEHLERAEQASLLREVDSQVFVFAHALIRRTLYQSLHAARRSLLHARVAAALEAGSVRPAPSAIIARHFLAAGDQESALRWAERAGFDALGSMAPDEAVHWFDQGCRLLATLHPDERLRLCDLTLQKGVALLLAGQPSFRDVLLESGAMAKAAGDGRRMAVAALANSRGYYSAAGQIDGDRVDLLEEALVLVGEADPMLRVRLIAAICRETAFGTPLAERRALADRAKSGARSLGDARTIVDVHHSVIEAVRYPTELADRLEDTAVALGLAHGLDDPSTLFWAIGHRMRTLMDAGRVVEAEHLFDRMVELAEEVGQPVMRWMATFSKAQWAFLHGQTEQGEQLAEEAYAIGTGFGEPDAFNYYATQLTHARWQQGRLGELVDLIAVGAEENPGIPAYRGALARALCQADRGSEARVLLDESTARRFAELPKDLLWTYGMATFAEAAIHLEHREAAEVLYKLMAPFADQTSFVGTTCEGPLAHYLGGLAALLGNHDEAARHLRAAARFAELARSPYFTARTSVESGRLAARRGDEASARRLLGIGSALAERGHFAAEYQRAVASLAALP